MLYLYTHSNAEQPISQHLSTLHQVGAVSNMRIAGAAGRAAVVEDQLQIQQRRVAHAAEAPDKELLQVPTSLKELQSRMKY